MISYPLLADDQFCRSLQPDNLQVNLGIARKGYIAVNPGAVFLWIHASLLEYKLVQEPGFLPGQWVYHRVRIECKGPDVFPAPLLHDMPVIPANRTSANLVLDIPEHVH